MGICRRCGKCEGVSKLYLLAYIPKQNKGSEQEVQAADFGMRIYGAIRPRICAPCLSGYIWRRIGSALLVWLLATAGVSLLAGLISSLFSLVWAGGGIVLLGLFWQMLKKIATASKTAKSMGIAALAMETYAKCGEIPAEDIVWRGPDCPSTDGGIPFVKTDVFNPDDLVPIEEGYLKEFSGDPNASRAAEAFKQAQAVSPGEDDISKLSLGKALWRPVVMTLNLLASAFILAMAVLELTEAVSIAGRSLTVDIGLLVLAGGLGLYGAILLLRRKASGYLFSGLMTGLIAAAIWISISAARAGGNRVDNSYLIVLVIVALPLLLTIPFFEGNRIKRIGGRK
jgi:uncharacterized membrane protein YiaA